MEQRKREHTAPVPEERLAQQQQRHPQPALPRRIARLDNLTANQIAAGEVVERPVSVVKELLENALDAGCTAVTVEMREGGLRLIRVADDGCGIDGRDMALAVERHATSKLRRIEDLDGLCTLGFRGEALASIASVSALEIVSRKKGEIAGCRLAAAGEEGPPEIGKTGCPEGTCITVEHLFFNTPARLKFMKSPGYEGGLIHDLMIQMALGYPHIGFRLESQGKVLFDTRDVVGIEDLVEMFYGRDAARALVPVEAPVSGGWLSGWATAPPYSRGSRKAYHLFVNGRRIGAKDMQWTVERAFTYLLPKGRFPLVILKFRLPGDILDVNVHPGKLEIRINDASFHSATTSAISLALSGGQLMPEVGDIGGTGGVDGTRGIGGIGGADGAGGTGGTGGIAANDALARAFPEALDAGLAPGLAAQPAAGFFADSAAGVSAYAPADVFGAVSGVASAYASTDASADISGISGTSGVSGVSESAFPGTSLIFPAPGPEGNAGSPDRGEWGVGMHNQWMQALAGSGLPEDFRFGPQTAFRVIGQLEGTFILAEVKAGLLVIDQHVAHERILFEQLLEKAGRKEAAQMLMQPLRVVLTSGEEEILIKNILHLNDLGLIFESIGPRQYVLRAEPAGHRMDQSMVRELLETLENEGADAGGAEQSLRIMSACKAAVKANTLLRPEEMRTLLTGLQNTRNPMTCPHGRPIMYLLPYRRLVRAFGRSSAKGGSGK